MPLGSPGCYTLAVKQRMHLALGWGDSLGRLLTRWWWLPLSLDPSPPGSEPSPWTGRSDLAAGPGWPLSSLLGRANWFSSPRLDGRGKVGGIKKKGLVVKHEQNQVHPSHTGIQDCSCDAFVVRLIYAICPLDTVYSLMQHHKRPFYGDGTENKVGELYSQRDTHPHWAVGREHNNPGCLSHSGAPASWL